MAAYKLVLIRHGESNWNQENRFCGWFDADLSETGEREAKRGGQALKGEEGRVTFPPSFGVSFRVLAASASIQTRPCTCRAACKRAAVLLEGGDFVSVTLLSHLASKTFIQSNEDINSF